MGCVPKKLMWVAANHAEELADLADYGFNISTADVTFDWATVKTKRDAYIQRLNGIYRANLERSKVEIIEGMGKFVGKIEC